MTTALAEDFDPEQTVINAIRGGDPCAFEEFVRRQNRWVRGVIYGVLGSHDAVDDVAQQVWTTVWQRIAELRDAQRWRSWLYRLTRNAALDAGREHTRRRLWRRSMAADLPRRTASRTAEGSLVRDEQHGIVLEAIRALPTLYREPFVLRHVNGWSYKEIADVMDMPVDSVETRLVRARRLLREALENKIG